MFTMANSNYSNRAALARALHACLRWRNADNRPPTSSPPNAANASASAANAANAGAATRNPTRLTTWAILHDPPFSSSGR